MNGARFIGTRKRPPTTQLNGDAGIARLLGLAATNMHTSETQLLTWSKNKF